MSVQHVVLLRFEPQLDEEGRAEMFTQVRAWPAEIGGFQELRLGSPISDTRTQGYQFLLFMVVDDRAALERYQAHPVHRRFSEWIVEHGGSVLSFDYELDASTIVERRQDLGRVR